MTTIVNRDIASQAGKDLLSQIQDELPRMTQRPVDSRGNQEYEPNKLLDSKIKHLLEELALGVRDSDIQNSAGDLESAGSRTYRVAHFKTNHH